MAYKKYIKRGGKVYGPYLYHSKRVDGKVVSEYHGAKKNFNYKKFVWIFLGVALIFLAGYILISLGNKMSGKSILGLEANYEEGEKLEGMLKLSLKEGELLPASSKIVFENSGEKYEYLLSDIISDELSEGDFYIEGKKISGEGIGYGKEGISIDYPIVYFTLDVYSDEGTLEDDEEIINELNENEEEIVEENVTDEESVVNETEEVVEEVIETEENTESQEIVEESEISENIEETSEENNEEIIEEVSEENSENVETPITGNIISSFFSWIGTGNLILELDTEVEGKVSAENPFIYDLSEGQKAEIKEGSVRTDSENLTSDILNVEIKDNQAIVSTDYSEERKGFGEDYVEDNFEVIEINLSSLDLIFEEGNLDIGLFYFDEELISLTAVLESGVPVKNKSLEEINVTENITNKTYEMPVANPLVLTDEEKDILFEEFGDQQIQPIREEVVDGKLILGYQLREYKIEYSYDYPQEEEILKIKIQEDKIKWLKNIVSTLLRKKEVPETIDIVEDQSIYDL